MANGYNWQCPHCNHHVTITVNRETAQRHVLTIDNAIGRQTLVTHFVVCPNPECQMVTLTAKLNLSSLDQVSSGGQIWDRLGKALGSWRLVPSSAARVFNPKIVPEGLIRDYEEACAIVDLSPKASATLSRRCLQGILRDYWKVKPGRLVDEIDEIKPKIDDLSWRAIDGVRKLGNIGAHMEKDINVIVDVDPNEAALMIGLVETLLQEWYEGKAAREARMNGVIRAAAGKKPPPCAGPTSTP